jgi:hypothetical protein
MVHSERLILFVLSFVGEDTNSSVVNKFPVAELKLKNLENFYHLLGGALVCYGTELQSK